MFRSSSLRCRRLHSCYTLGIEDAVVDNVCSHGQIEPEWVNFALSGHRLD